MKDGIELYEVTGQALDNAWIAKNRSILERHTYDDMRANGFVPVLDYSPTLTAGFNAEQEVFDFKISIYGYNLGPEAKNYMGVIMSDGILVSKDAKKVALCDVKGL